MLFITVNLTSSVSDNKKSDSILYSLIFAYKPMKVQVAPPFDELG